VRVINVADPHGRRLAAELDGAVTFAVAQRADYRASSLRCGLSGCHFTLHSPAGEREVELPMPGRFNVANGLAALAATHAMGGDLDVLVAALERGVRVPGRFEPVDEGQDFAVIVDYAHTPDSLGNVLASARTLMGSEAERTGRLVCVFGAGGDRDRGKRPLMGEIAARMADVALVTSDNPRSEDPARIIAEILAGAERVAGAGVRINADRAEAIAEALELARAGDVVVIAGKGHEQGQELTGGVKVPFDDVTVAREALRRVSAAARR
jgi:UDP-N-acetylmuramoyl-L-alanyl-D-glutamate--2,6-diaminopimelate ligase